MLAPHDQPLVRGRNISAHTLSSWAGWFPVAIGDASAAPPLWWRHLGERRFKEAFFQDTLAAQPSSERQVCQTPLAALDQPGPGVGDSLPLTAVIFHVSRCGSTLLTQLLAALPQCSVLSEPPVLDAFLRLHHRQPGTSGGLPLLRRLVAALAQRRSAQERHCILKLDSWHMPWMPWLREAFPDTPFVLLYREPDEVLASHRRQRGLHMVPGLLDLTRLAERLPPTPPAPGDLDGHAAQVLAAVFESALDAAAGPAPVPGLTLVDYRQLPDIAWTRLLPAWPLPFDGAGLGAMRERAGQHAKHGHQAFTGDAPGAAAPSPSAAALEGLARARRSHAALQALRFS